MPNKAKVVSEPETELKEELSSPDGSKQGQKKKKARRTKTGCLTCRKRRVKCDECKPTCRNCEKSRRVCEGYQLPQMRSAPIAEAFFPAQAHPSPTFNLAPHRPEYVPPHYGSDTATTPSFSHDISPHEYPTVMMTGVHQQGHGFPFVETGMTVEYGQPTVGYDWSAPPVIRPQAYFDMHHPLNYESSSRRPGPSRESSASSYVTKQTRTSPKSLKSTPMAERGSRQFYAENIQEDPNDPWDVDSDDEMGVNDALINFSTPRSLILDERMAYLLKHFVTFLRPCISIHERPILFDGTSTFAEKLPTLALSNRGLLHGLLAVSALHLAVIHGTSEAIPLKHFVIASKKLAKLITSPVSRHELGTLGLCLILAFYEVLLGDHARWILHLRGATAFLMEHDYAGFARSVRSLRSRARANLAQPWVNHAQLTWDEYIKVAGIPPDLLRDEDWDVDEALVRKLTGLEIDYSNQVQPTAKSLVSEHTLSQDDIRDWRTKSDLLFWSLKMDVFQSVLSGDQLLLPYNNWKFFVPRGKIGSASNVHATMDYLWLVLGRLAEFGAKDRRRKLRKMATTRGEWVPEDGFLDLKRAVSVSTETKAAREKHVPLTDERGADPRANEGRTRTARKPSNSSKTKKTPPLFFGMMPPPKIPPSMLTSFHITDTALCHDKPQKDEPPAAADTDLTTATKEALIEHAAIIDALQSWKEALSTEFDASYPLSAANDSPFEPVRRYKDPAIACVWSLYHLGRILARRYHPYSPPAMMVSAGVNAAFTAEDAQIIGSINVGLLQTQSELASAGSINPTLVAALQELTFPLMFAGVQFQTLAQRAWAIESLLDLARDSGWRTASSVAMALETAWEAQGNYKRTLSARRPHDYQKYDPSVVSGEVGKTPEEEHHSRFVNHDRRLIDRFSDLRAFWAVGLLSSEDDLHMMMQRVQLDNSS